MTSTSSGQAAHQQATVSVSGAVSAALAAGRPVVALESTIFSQLGLPAPANREALRRCLAAVRAGGAEPAVTAILDGKARVGLEPGEEDRVLAGSAKIAERDIAVAVAQGLDVGVTTVSASVALAHAVGIQVFATGGIGGVHRGAELTGDISADLDALANHPVITVCAGAKAFLDLARTLEYLETAGVPVLGWQHDWFPAFYLRSSGLSVPHRVETARVAADVLLSRVRERTGVLLTVPIPAADELDPGPLNRALEAALAECAAAGITGAAVTPFVLGRIERQTAGASIPANLALAENNARVAAAVANCAWYSRAYAPPAASSSAWVPCSTMCPPSITKITSASRMVDSRWAITKLVRPCRSDAIACWMSTSVLVSTELVASSRMRTAGRARKARAIVISWRSPALTLVPSSSSTVS